MDDEILRKKYIRLNIYDPNSDSIDPQIIKIQHFDRENRFGRVIGTIVAKKFIDLLGLEEQAKSKII